MGVVFVTGRIGAGVCETNTIFELPPITTIRCSKCMEVKPLGEFHRDKGKKIGHTTICKSCVREGREALAQRYETYGHEHVEEQACHHCKQTLPAEAFAKNRNLKNGLNRICKKCMVIYTRESRKNNPAQWLYKAARNRAVHRGLEFDITRSDIIVPAICPVFGIELKYTGGKCGGYDNSPSLDRIDSSKGYVKGNIWVISWKANRLKNDASIDELRAIADAMEAVMNGATVH